MKTKSRRLPATLAQKYGEITDMAKRTTSLHEQYAKLILLRIEVLSIEIKLLEKILHEMITTSRPTVKEGEGELT